jgi:RNA polymerase sigma-70 factor (ECF subfamily)
VIDAAPAGHCSGTPQKPASPMTLPECAPLPVADVRARSRAEGSAETASAAARLRTLVDTHYDFVWRTLRYMGVPDANAEDAAQEVLCVLARRLDDVAPGAEMSFLFSTAMRVASEARRAARRRPAPIDQDVDALLGAAPSADDLVDRGRALALLRQVLDEIPIDLRVIFVLFELEELTLPEAAKLVGIPTGTAASRLRRARERFRSIVRRVRAAGAWETGQGRPR